MVTTILLIILSIPYLAIAIFLLGIYFDKTDYNRDNLKRKK